jgi:deazaflavin-dependent oxidoreductase (nitroreductase family)
LILDDDQSREEYCYLTTNGRISGRPHTIEIWFGVAGNSVFLLSGGGEKPDWVRNLRAQPRVSLRIGQATWQARARIVTDQEEDGLARRLLLEKYQRPGSEDLGDWGRRALPVAVDLQGESDLD